MSIGQQFVVGLAVTVIGGGVLAYIFGGNNIDDRRDIIIPPPPPSDPCQNAPAVWQDMMRTCNRDAFSSFYNAYYACEPYRNLAQDQLNMIDANLPGSACYRQPQVWPTCESYAEFDCTGTPGQSINCFWDAAAALCRPPTFN